jgi:hypothetical protein
MQLVKTPTAVENTNCGGIYPIFANAPSGTVIVKN